MIAIIGAGISGLTLAWYLQKNNIAYLLLESSDRVGGNIGTLRLPGHVQAEAGPNSLLCDNEVMEILREAGLEQELQYPAPVSKDRFILRNGRYHKLPSSPPALLGNPFFSLRTRWRIMSEFFRKPSAPSDTDETLSEFFRRRFNQQVVDYALNPFVSGIYAGDPDRLLLKHTFPALMQYEQRYGSVIKGLVKEKSGGRKVSVNFRKGMQMLPEALASGLQHLRLNAPVSRLSHQGAYYQLETPQGIVKAEKVVMALPAHAAADLLQSFMPAFAQSLLQVSYPPMAVVHSLYRRADVAHSLHGFGGLNPSVENTFSAGSIWASSVFEGRCPPEQVLLTSFVGGSLRAQNTAFPDDYIKERVHQELGLHYGIAAPPLHQHLVRWEKAIPQYDAAMNELSRLVQWHEQHSQLYVCANWYGGVSLADCMKKGKALATRLSKAAATH